MKKNNSQEKVVLYDERALKAVSKTIPGYFDDVSEIIEILISNGIPALNISDSANKSDILLKAFLDIKSGNIKPKFDNQWEKSMKLGERYISRIIEEFVHPWSLKGDNQKVEELSGRLQNIVTHDDLGCYKFGKTYRIFEKGEYEVAEELRQGDMQDSKLDLLDGNDAAAREARDRERLINYKKTQTESECDLVRKEGIFYYKGKDLKLQEGYAYVKAFIVLFENVDENGFCSYANLKKAFKKKYPDDFKGISRMKKTFNSWMQGMLTDKINGFPRKVRQAQLVEVVRGEGLKFNNKKSRNPE